MPQGWETRRIYEAIEGHYGGPEECCVAHRWPIANGFELPGLIVRRYGGLSEFLKAHPSTEPNEHTGLTQAFVNDCIARALREAGRGQAGR